MGKCLCHPEVETSYLCMKDNVYLCAECLKCRHPNIYCKFRSSCPIWYMQTKGAEWGDEKIAGAEGAVRTVVFMPDNKEVKVPEGTTLLEAAQAADVRLNASCNGKGACGKCKLIVESGDIDTNSTHLLSEKEKEKNYALACQSIVRGDVTVRIPEETSERRLKVAGLGKEATEQLSGRVKEISPMLLELPLELSAPTLDEDIIFSEADIENIIRSKGAVYAGFTVLLKQTGLEFSMVDRLWIAGGFGQYLDIEKAIIIGMLPDIDRKKFQYLGNSSIAGAYMALLSNKFREEARKISKKMTYIDFSSNSQFMDEFSAALFLPHTNIKEFPNIKRLLNVKCRLT